MVKEHGFTLMEVLVATAICGIALGVALSGLSQGHRATRRALQMKEAGLALRLSLLDLESKKSQGLYEEEGTTEEEIQGMDGWSYEVEVVDLTISLRESDGNGTDQGQGEEEVTQEFQIEGMKQVILKVKGPEGRTFRLVSWR